MSAKRFTQEAADRRVLADAMKYAQALEDGYEFLTEVDVPAGTLVPGRLFQISRPDIDGNHVRELGWYRFDSAVRHPESEWGTVSTGETNHGPKQ